jgi:hypothetical protein
VVIDDEDFEELRAREVPKSTTAAASRVTTFSKMMSIESPKIRTPQYTNLKGKKLYYAVCTSSRWIQAQEFMPWFSPREITLLWLVKTFRLAAGFLPHKEWANIVVDGRSRPLAQQPYRQIDVGHRCGCGELGCVGLFCAIYELHK